MVAPANAENKIGDSKNLFISDTNAYFEKKNWLIAWLDFKGYLLDLKLFLLKRRFP